MALMPVLTVKRFARPSITEVAGVDPLVALLVDSYSHTAIGGPDRATILATGPAHALGETIDWLRCPIEIRDDGDRAVWWGFISAVRLRIGAIEIGVTLDTFANTVKVIYTSRLVGETAGSRADTAWVDDDVSVATYGVKEIVISSDVADSFAAVSLRDTVLAAIAYPVPTLRIGDGQEVSATLECSGWWYTGDWRYYEESAVIASSFETTGTHTLYSARSISFDSNASYINDSASGLGPYDLGDNIMVTGVDTRGAWLVTDDPGSGTDPSNSAMHVEELSTGNPIGGQGAGGLVTLENSFLPVGYHNDYLGVAQSFTAPTPAVRLNSITVWARVFDNPTSNRLKCDLFADVAGSPGGSVLASGYNARGEEGFSGNQEVPAGAPADFIPANPPMQPRTFHMLSGGAEIVLTAGATYWIVLTSNAAGGFNGAEFFIVQINRAGGAAGSLMRKDDAPSWNAYTGDLLHIVTGKPQTTKQITDMLASDYDYIAGSIVELSSGVYSDAYQDGDTTAKTVLEELLALGSSNNRRLLATVTPERYMRVYEEPASNTSDIYRMGTDGILRDRLDLEIPPYLTPAAVWVKLIDVLPITIDTSVIGSPSPFFIERVEYSASTGRVRIEPKAAPSAQNLGRISQG